MNKQKNHRIISCIFFAVYVCVLVYFLFFAENMGRIAVSRDYRYNLVPFREIYRFIKYREIIGIKGVLLNLVGNVAAFIPFGLFIIPVFGYRIKVYEAVLLIFDVSLFVEIVQLVTRVGSMDVDDILLNTIGGTAGVLMYFGYKAIERKRYCSET